MANLGCLLVHTFGNFLVPILVSAQTVSEFYLKQVDKGLIKGLILKVMKFIK